MYRARWARGLSWLGLVLVVKSALLPGSSYAGLSLEIREASAQEGEDPLVVARGKFQRAIELKAAGDFGGALSLLREVGQVKMTPQVRYHIASCEENLGRLVAAYGGYDLALQQGQGMPQDFIVEVEGALGRLNERIPKLVLQRGSGAEAATIELDGVVLGSSSIGPEMPVDPGPHSISASAPGQKAFSTTIQAEESKTQTVEVVLLPEEKRIDVRPPPPPPPPPKGYGVAPYIVGASGLVMTLVGVVLLPVSQANIGRAMELCKGSTDCSQPGISNEDRNEATAIVSSAHSVEAVGWTMIGVGLATTGVGAALYLLDPARNAANHQAEAKPLDVRFGARHADVGLTVLGSF